MRGKLQLDEVIIERVVFMISIFSPCSVSFFPPFPLTIIKRLRAVQSQWTLQETLWRGGGSSWVAFFVFTAVRKKKRLSKWFLCDWVDLSLAGSCANLTAYHWMHFDIRITFLDLKTRCSEITEGMTCDCRARQSSIFWPPEGSCYIRDNFWWRPVGIRQEETKRSLLRY